MSMFPRIRIVVNGQLPIYMIQHGIHYVLGVCTQERNICMQLKIGSNKLFGFTN